MGAIVMTEPFVTTRTFWPDAKPSAASHFPFRRRLGTTHSFFRCAEPGSRSVCGQTGAVYTVAEAANTSARMPPVTDRVDGVHQSKNGNIFLNMGGKYQNQAFTAFISAKSAGQFSDFQKYEGQTLAVSGKITLYHGKPEIVVTLASQIVMK